MDFKNLGLVSQFIKKNLSGRTNKELRVLDVGSRDEMKHHSNLVYRRYFNNPNWKYIGVDIVSGPNVDMVLDNPYNYPYIDSIFDLVICTSVLEHVEEPIRLIRELLRITKEYIILVVPWDRPIHNYPIDYWRMSPEALINFVTENNKFEMLEYGMLGRDSYIIAKRI